MSVPTSETSKRAEYWFAKSAIAVDVAKTCIAAACLNPRFKESADYFSNRALYFLSLATAWSGKKLSYHGNFTSSTSLR